MATLLHQIATGTEMLIINMIIRLGFGSMYCIPNLVLVKVRLASWCAGLVFAQTCVLIHVGGVVMARSCFFSFMRTLEGMYIGHPVALNMGSPTL